MVCHAPSISSPGECLSRSARAAVVTPSCFELNGAEWADVKAQARKRPNYAAIAAARASTPSSAPDFKLTDDAGS